MGDLILNHHGVCHKPCVLAFTKESNLKLAFFINCYSIGDTISATPVLAELRRLYPKAIIDVITKVPEIFKYNNKIRNIVFSDERIPDQAFKEYDMIINSFDTSIPTYPFHWATHSVQFSAHCALRKTILFDMDYDVKYTFEEKQNMKRILIENNIHIDNEKVILIHPYTVEWKTRSWDFHNWLKIIDFLKQKAPDKKILAIGGSREFTKKMSNYFPYDGCIDMYNKLGLLESLALMDHPNVEGLITTDTGTLHLGACAKELKIFGIFSLVKSVYRTPYRKGIFGYKFWGIDNYKCSCTYDTKLYTEDIYLPKCLHVRILENLLMKDFSQEEINNVWINRGYDKETNNICPTKEQILQLKMKYEKPQCFPDVQKVIDVINANMF
jgi:ADP-heptose:LPS heptosyltransferase